MDQSEKTETRTATIGECCEQLYTDHAEKHGYPNPTDDWEWYANDAWEECDRCGDIADAVAYPEFRTSIAIADAIDQHMGRQNR